MNTHVNPRIYAQSSRRPPPVVIPEAITRADALIAEAQATAVIRAQGERSPGGESGGGFVRQLGEDFHAFTQRHGGDVAALRSDLQSVQAALDQMNLIGQVGAGAPSGARPVDPAYTDLFASWARRGDGEQELRGLNLQGDRGAVRAAMSEGSSNAGGYLAPVEWDRQIQQQQLPFSPMRSICTVRPTSVRGYSTVWSDQQWGTGWVGETAARPQTTNPNLSPVLFAPGELYAMPVASQSLLEDAQLNLAEWLGEELGKVFGRQEDIAFVAGTGVNMPAGFLTYLPGGSNAATHPGGSIGTTAAATAGTIVGDDLISLVYSLTSPYRPNARWVMNSLTASVVAKMKDGEGRYIWREAFLAGQPPSLLGYPVTTDENMPNLAAGNTPIAFGDFKSGYIINDRIGTTILRDPYTNKPFVNFYARKRVGGGVQDPFAIRVLQA